MARRFIMGFLRVSASADGKLKQPLRAGAGFIANVAPVNITTASGTVNITVQQISGGAILQDTFLTGSTTYILPDAVDVLAEWPEMDIGDAFTFWLCNNQTATFTLFLNQSATITKAGAGTSLQLAAGAGRMITLVKESETTMIFF